jgi:hypothetical protein
MILYDFVSDWAHLFLDRTNNSDHFRTWSFTPWVSFLFLIFLWYFYFNLHFLYSLVFVCLFLTLILTTIFFNYMILSLEQLLKSSSDFQLIELARSFAIIRKLFLHFFRKNRDAILKMFLCNCWKNTFSLNILTV